MEIISERRAHRSHSDILGPLLSIILIDPPENYKDLLTDIFVAR